MFLLSSCKLVLTSEITTKERSIIRPLTNYVGVKITLYNHSLIDNTIVDYYYLDGELSSFIYEIKVNKYRDKDGVNITEHDIYYHLTPKYNCFYITTLIRENGDLKELDSSTATCTDFMAKISHSIGYGYKDSKVNEKIIFNVNFSFMPKFISYEVIEYDQSHNKLVSKTITLDNISDEYIIQQDTAYCKIIYQYLEGEVSQSDVKIIDHKDIINGYTERFYTLTENDERAFYIIQFKVEPTNS